MMMNWTICDHRNNTHELWFRATSPFPNKLLLHHFLKQVITVHQCHFSRKLSTLCGALAAMVNHGVLTHFTCYPAVTRDSKTQLRMTQRLDKPFFFFFFFFFLNGGQRNKHSCRSWLLVTKRSWGNVLIRGSQRICREPTWHTAEPLHDSVSNWAPWSLEGKKSDSDLNI